MANDIEKRITAKMVLDSTGFNSNLKGINNQLKLTQSELKNASSQVGLFGKNSEQLKGVQEALAKQVELHAKKVDVYRDSLEKTTIKMNDNIKERDKLKSSLENATKSYDEAIKLYGKESDEAKKAKSTVNELTQEYQKKENAIESNAKQINNYETNLNKANAELNKTKIELNNVNTELSKSNNKWLVASETLKASSEKLKNIGSSLSNAGDKILKISAPLVGAGIASLKFAVDFEDSIAKVSTISDESEVSIGDLRKQILALSSDTGIASTDIANNVYDAISAGQKTGDAMNFVANSTKLAKAGFAEAGESLDLLTTILNAYKMKSEEVTNVSDLLIQVQNKGKVTVGELSSVMGKVIPTAVATGTSLSQIGAGYAIMTSNGIKAAESTTYINSMLNELSKTGSDADKALRKMTGKSFTDLMKQGKSLGDVLVILDDYAKKNKLSLSDMFGSAEAGKSALILSTNAGKDFNDMLKDMNNVAGSTDDAFKKVTDTTGEKFRKSLNQLKNEAIRFGDAVSPLLEKGSELIGKISDKLGQMDEKQLKNIASIGLFTVGLGGVLKVGGGVVSTVGSIAGGLSKLTGVLGTATTATSTIGTASAVASGAGGLGALATGLGSAIVAAAPFVLAGVAVAGVGYGIYNALTKEAIPSVDLFAEKIETTSKTVAGATGSMSEQYEANITRISESTKKGVEAYVELDNKAKDKLSDLYINSTIITGEISKDTIGKFTNMKTQVVAGYEAQKTESIKQLQEMFATSRNITATEQADILANTTSYFDRQQEQTEIYEKQIKVIMESASNEKRALTESEVTEIINLQNKMRSNAVNALSQNEIEAKVILQRMKDYDTRITAEQAAEHIKKLNESKDKAIALANDEYDKKIATIIKMRDESKTISANQADKLIAEAKRQRDGIVNEAEATKNKAIDKMKEMNGELEKQVSLDTGKILTWWDKLKSWWNSWSPASKSFSYTLKPSASNSYDASGGHTQIYQNARGTDYFSGGLTTLNEEGYEVYDLPRGTRIYNHDASEDLVKKTAAQVSKSILSGIDLGGTQTIIIPVSLDGREIARATATYMDNVQGNNLKFSGRGQGLG